VVVNPEAKWSWQYNGAAPFIDILQWCYDNFGYDNWSATWETISFDDEKDYAWFVLRWV
jgi:hypothetical protein